MFLLLRLDIFFSVLHCLQRYFVLVPQQVQGKLNHAFSCVVCCKDSRLKSSPPVCTAFTLESVLLWESPDSFFPITDHHYIFCKASTTSIFFKWMPWEKKFSFSITLFRGPLKWLYKFLFWMKISILELQYCKNYGVSNNEREILSI